MPGASAPATPVAAREPCPPDPPPSHVEGDRVDPEGTSVVVSVRDGRGKPVSGCRVEVVPASDMERFVAALRVPAHASPFGRDTDSQGTAVFEDVGRGVHFVRARDERFAPSGTTIDTDQAADRVEVRLDVTPTAVVIGRCRDHLGRPLRGARPAISVDSRDLEGWLASAPAPSGADGEFRLSGLPAWEPGSEERIVLELSHADFSDTLRIPVVLESGATIDVGTVAFEAPACRAVGRVVGDDGEPFGGLTLFVREPAADGEPNRDELFEFPLRAVALFAKTDADGQFEFTRLIPGPYALDCLPLAFRPRAKVEFVFTFPGEEIDLGTLVAGTGTHRFFGQVTDTGGSPLSGVLVRLRNSGGVQTTTDASGTFELFAAEPGPFHLEARRRLTLVRAETVLDEIRRTVEPGSEIVIRFVTGSLTLLFRDALSGDAAWPCRTTLSATNGVSGFGMTNDLPTDRLILRHDLRPGAWRFLVVCRSFEPRTVCAEVPLDWETRDVVVDVPLIPVRQDE